MPRIQRGDPKNRKKRRLLRSQMTPAERRLWLRLRAKEFLGLKFRRQHGVGPYIVDFYCPERSIVIEVDGDVHAKELQGLKDRMREEALRNLGLQIFRYTNDEILTNLEGVLEDLRVRLVS